MPAFTLEATADGANNAWTLFAGPSKWQAMADSDDGTSIYAPSASSPCRQSFVTQDLPGDAAAITPPVTANCRGRDVSATADLCYSHFRYGGANYEDASGWNFTTSIADYVSDWNNAPGGGSWTPAILNACEMGVYRAGNTNNIQVYKLYVSGNYTQAGACFIPLLSLAAAAIGPGLQLAHMPGLARAISARRVRGCRSLIRPDEYQAALASWRAYRHPRHIILAG